MIFNTGFDGFDYTTPVYAGGHEGSRQDAAQGASRQLHAVPIVGLDHGVSPTVKISTARAPPELCWPARARHAVAVLRRTRMQADARGLPRCRSRAATTTQTDQTTGRSHGSAALHEALAQSSSNGRPCCVAAALSCSKLVREK
jgi:hypothetical protein